MGGKRTLALNSKRMAWVLPNELVDFLQTLGIRLDISPTSVGKESKASIPKSLDFLPLLFV